MRFYNKRGTAEQWIKEGKQTVAMTRLSCHRFRANEVRLWLSVIALVAAGREPPDETALWEPLQKIAALPSLAG